MRPMFLKQLAHAAKNAPKNVRNSRGGILKRLGSYKRVSTVLAAFVVCATLIASLVVWRVQANKSDAQSAITTASAESPASLPMQWQRLRLSAFERILSPDLLAVTATFTPGNLVVVQMGDGVAALSGSSASVSLLEYTTSGSSVQTIAVPSTGASPRLTVTGSSTSEGHLVRSSDGRFLTLTGYDVVAGTATGFAVAGTPRVIGRINSAGTVDLTTALTDGSTGAVRSAASTNGADLWMTNSGNGLRYKAFGSSGTSTQVTATPVNTRVVKVFNGQLYMTSGSAPFTCVNAVGSGTPTTSGNATIAFPGMTCTGRTPYSFSISPSGTTMYVADDGGFASNGGIQKWTFSAGTWSNVYTLLNTGAATTAVRGLTVDWSGANPIVYATTAAASPNTLIKVTDTGSGSLATTVATAPTNTVFRGVDLAPQTITLSPATLPNGTVGVAYNNPITASGGISPYTFAITSGAQPTGLTLNSDGTWSGMPSAAGPFSFTVTATDAGGLTGSQAYSVTIVQPTIIVTGGPLTFANTVVGGTSAEQTYTVSGSNLTADITVTAPSTDFQVSTTTGAGFGPSVTFTQTGGTVATQTVFVRFTPQSAGPLGGNVTNTSSGATTQNVAVSGNGVGPCVPPSTVYVDDDWAAFLPGNDPDGAGPATNFGCDSFATIQNGVDGVTAGGQVIVYAGTYPEGNNTIDLTKAVTVSGPNSAISPNTGVRVAEAVVTSQGTSIAPNGVFRLNVPNLAVTIEGLKFDGTPAAINAYADHDTISLKKNIFTASHDPGMYFETPTLITIADNRFVDILSVLTEDTIAVAANVGVARAPVTITNNVWSNVAVGGLLLTKVSGTISGNQFFNVQYYGTMITHDSGDLTISDNVFNGITNPDPVNVPTYGSGVRFYEPAVTSPVNITGNTFTNSHTGVGVRGVPNDPGADISGMPIHVNFNRFIGNNSGINDGAAGTLDAENNWWGCNYGPGTGGVGCTGTPNGISLNGSGTVDADPWIVLLGSATPSTIAPFGTSTVAADMTHNSTPAVPVGTLPNIPVGYSATNGNMSPTSDTIIAGADSSLFTSTNSSNAVATITVDGQAVNVPITVVTPCVPPAVVYVDDDWVGTAPGADPDGGGPATNFGCDSFATIQDGVNAVTSGGTVIVRAGTYPEAILINKPLTLNGAQVGANANTRFAAFTAGGPPNGPKANPAIESVITAAAVNPNDSVNNPIHIMSSNVTIDGFVVDGNNPLLTPTGAVVIGGINTDARRGIQTDDGTGAVFFPANNVNISNNVVQNFNSHGMQLINGPDSGSAPATSGSLIDGNLVRNFGGGNGSPLTGGSGIVLRFNAHADITNNTVVTNDYPTESGIWLQDFLDHGTPIPITIANNNVTVGQDNFGGIWVNLAYLSALNINNNTVNAAPGVTGASDFTFGIYLSTQRPGSAASLSGNIVGSSGGEFSRGIALWSLGSATPTTVTGGTVGKSLKGVSLHVSDPNFGLAGANSAVNTTGVSIDGTGVAADIGIFVDATGSTGDTVAMEISGNTSIINTNTAIDVVGTNASANIHDNAASIHNNTIGIDVNGGSATITSNNLFANTTGLQFGTGATVTAHFNRIISTAKAIDNPASATANVENNWWGCNAGPGNIGCGAISGTGVGVDFDPWIVLGVSASPAAIPPFTNSTITADMTKNSNNVPAGGTLPDIPVAWSAVNGTMSPTNGTVVASTASSTFTSTSTSNGSACATVDNQLLCTPITVFPTTVTIVPAPVPTAADNDYTRINNAVQATFNGQTIKLLGTFNWTEPFAAASWSRGSNDIGGDLDDYSILVPANLNNVTFTADTLGDAEIQGPGDLAAVSLESVFFFNGGDNQNWTISNIRFLDFDLSIGMFNGAGGVDAFNNTIIQNNYIRIARDLNATVAPGEDDPNAGIWYSFGTNQIISGNTIEIQGDAVSDSGSGNFAAEIGMLCNTSGGAVYDGLQITNNTITVLNAQSADPETVIGIWDNAHGHTSNITISGNQFTNLAGGNSPSANLQRGFRVTSHSSPTTNVIYQNNTVIGANIGFQWLAGQAFSGNLPVKLISNTIRNNATGLRLQSQGVANLSFNRIVGNTVTGLNNVDGIATAENNWWGCNAGPGGGGCDTVTGVADFNPWLKLGVSASPNPIAPGGNSTITADMRFNSDAVNTSGSGTLPPTPVAWSATQGAMSPPTGTVTLGLATSTFTSTSALSGTACATVDNQLTCTNITVASPVTVSLPHVTGPITSNITVPITVSDLTGKGVKSYDFQITFTASIVQPQAIPFDTAGTLSSGMTVTFDTTNPGHLIISASQATDLTGLGTLINLKFTIVGAPGQVTATSFQDFNDGFVVHPGFRFNVGVPAAVTSNGSITVNGPTASNGTVSGQIVDGSGNRVEGAAIRMGGTQNRLTITDAQGNYHFDNVETGGFYTVTPSRANYVFAPAQRSFSQIGQNTEAVFSASSTSEGLNPLDTTEYFVRQQYVDFLSREPDEAGFNFWVNNIAACGTDSDCLAAKRTDTSAAFFLSIEFQQTGYLVHRMYQSAYGDMAEAPVPLTRGQFRPDTETIGAGVVVNQSGWEAKLESNTQAFASEFVGRTRFTSAYPVTMTPTEFVDRLFRNGGVTPEAGDLAAAISEFGGAADTADAAARARAVRRVAENATLREQEVNQAFVLMQYFGYLRRDPNTGPDTDFSGYNFWLNKLDSFNGDFRAAEMVKAFLVAGEYRGRFPR